MAKPTIVTRASKGSALTWTEGDANFTNLRDATLTVTDGTNSKALDLNSTLNFIAGTNITVGISPLTGAVTITNTQSATTPAGSNTQVQFNNSGAFGASSKLLFDGSKLSTENLTITNSVGDEGGEILLAKAQTNTTLAGTGVTIDVYQNKLRIFEQGGTARGAYIDLTAAGAGVSSNLLSGGSFDPASPGAIGGTTPAAITGTTITANTAFAGPHNGTVGATTPSTGAFTTLSASSTVSGTGFSTYLASPPAIGGTTPSTGAFTTLSSTGTLTFKQPIEAIYDLGTTGGTIAPNCSNGSVQKITLNSALTINAFTSPVAGQSLTLIIYGGTAYTSITSTMKFAGGVKTLTGTAGCIDILTVYYDGTTYFASLGKGYA
jgi:hypothetical protein